MKRPAHTAGWPIIARSRTIRDESKTQTHYHPPVGHQAPQDRLVRHELLSSAQALYDFLEVELDSEAFLLRCQNMEKNLRQLIKQAQDRLRQSETSLREAQKEENWQLWGTYRNPLSTSRFP